MAFSSVERCGGSTNGAHSEEVAVQRPVNQREQHIDADEGAQESRLIISGRAWPPDPFAKLPARFFIWQLDRLAYNLMWFMCIIGIEPLDAAVAA